MEEQPPGAPAAAPAKIKFAPGTPQNGGGTPTAAAVRKHQEAANYRAAAQPPPPLLELPPGQLVPCVLEMLWLLSLLSPSCA